MCHSQVNTPLDLDDDDIIHTQHTHAPTDASSTIWKQVILTRTQHTSILLAGPAFSSDIAGDGPPRRRKRKAAPPTAPAGTLDAPADPDQEFEMIDIIDDRTSDEERGSF